MAATCSRRWRGGLTSRAGDRHSGEGRPAGAQGGNPREPARDRGAASAGRLRHRALGAQAQRRPGRGDRSAGGRQAYRVASVDDASSQEPRGRPSNRGLVSGAARTIEQVVQVMKSQGFDLEESQIGTPEAMAKLALAVLIAALRIMQLVNARSVTTGQKLADAMGEAAGPLVEILTRKLEGKTVKLKNPHPRVRARAPGVGRRPAGRLRRLYRARLQASRTHHNDQRPRPLRRHPRRMGDPPKSVNPLGRRPRLSRAHRARLQSAASNRKQSGRARCIWVEPRSSLRAPGFGTRGEDSVGVDGAGFGSDWGCSSTTLETTDAG